MSLYDLRVYNRTSARVEVAISNHSRSAGNPHFIGIRAQSSNSWSRAGPEIIRVQRGGSDMEVFAIRPGIDVEILPLDDITVINQSGSTVNVKVSNDSNLADPAIFVELRDRDTRTWRRSRPEVIFIQTGGSIQSMTGSTYINIDTRMGIPGGAPCTLVSAK